MTLVSEERVRSLDPVFGAIGIEAGVEIWNSDDLTAREKAIVLIASDVAVPELGLPFELHVEMAVTKVEMPVEHVREILRHVSPDAGFNITAMAFQKLTAIFAALGIEPSNHDGKDANESANNGPFTSANLHAVQASDPAFADLIQRHCNRLWSRPYLGARERAFATLAVDVIGGTLGAPFAIHLAIARSVGLTRGDIFAMLRVLAEFSIPKAWEAHAVLTANEPVALGGH